LFGALLTASRRYGSSITALEDHERQPLTYGRLVIASMVLGRKLADRTEKAERVGIMMPNVQAIAPVLFGLNAYGRIPALLNYTSGIRNLSAACQVGDLRLIVTSRRFIEQGKLDDVIAAFEADGRNILYLEDLRKEITSFDKLSGVIRSWFARSIQKRSGMAPADDALILFTSGSEGVPKGVVLTNANLVANTRQIDLRVRQFLKPDDAVFNPLPVFHSFGLTAGLFLGLFGGLRVVLYPSPLHFRQIPKLIAATGATLLMCTDTFARNYVRAAEGDALSRIRFVIAGAEQVKLETRALWDRFGTVILEGYGVTECAPVLAVNLPDAQRFGTVGRLLPGVESRLEPVEGLKGGGRLFVRGPNVMRGYLDKSAEGGVLEAEDGWHDTGDIVTIEDGFVSIRGRAKRFAKLGGEMVSLAAIEALVQQLWPDNSHVVVSLPDPRKGEQLVLVTDRGNADRDELLAFGRDEGFPELWIPRSILVSNIPVMGSGKVDYPATVEMAQKLRTML